MSKDTKKDEYFPSKVCLNKVFGVIGVCGVVGNLVARVLMDNWYKVICTDIQNENNCEFKYTLKDYHPQLYLGGHPESFFLKSNFIIPPPSLPENSNFFKSLKTNSQKDKYEIISVEDVIDFINPDKPVLCVTGTNGKTTTVSLLKHICSFNGLNPTEHGFKHLQGNIEYIPPLQCRLKGDVAILETGTFGKPGDLKFVVERSNPDCGIITNITPDHMQDDQDFLKYASIKGEFVDYLKDGMLIVNGDDPTVWGLIESRIPDTVDVITFGVDNQTGIVNEKRCWCGRELPVNETISGMGTYNCECGLKNPQIDYLATDIKEDSFTLKTPGEVFKVTLPLLGLHNIYNTLGAIVAAKEFFNMSIKDILSNILTFKGVPGRLDYLGEYQGRKVIIDYAHNPGGVETVLRELKKIYKPLAVVINVSSESGEGGNIDILNKSLDNSDYVIPASYYSRKAADNYIKEGNPGSDKIILTPKYPEKFKKGTLGANLEQISHGLETALNCDVQAVVCIGEAALTFRKEIRKMVGSPEGSQEGQS
jgi:UDP-N-acetylmuramate--alanine ligase